MAGSDSQVSYPDQERDVTKVTLLADAAGNVLGGVLPAGLQISHLSDFLTVSHSAGFAEWWATLTAKASESGQHSATALCKVPGRELHPVTVSVAPVTGRQEYLVSFSHTAQRALALLSALHSISVASSRESLDVLLRAVREQLLALIPATTFYVMLFDEEADTLYPREVFSNGEIVEGPKLSSRSGLVGWVMTNRQGLNIKDIEQAELPVSYVRFGDRPVSRSVLLVPLVVQDECVGVLSVQHTEPDVYTDTDLWLLEAVASQTAVAIRDASLHEQTMNRLRMLTFLQDFSVQLASADHISELARGLCQALDGLLKPDAIRVFLQSQPRNGLDAAYYYSASESPVFGIVHEQLPDPVAVKVHRSGEPVVINQPDEATDTLVHLDWTPVALAAYPIRRGDQPLGVLVLCYRTPHLFRQDEQRTLMLIARQTAIAVERVQYYQDLSKRFDQVSALYALAQQVTGTLDGQNILQLVVHTLKHIFRCRACVVALREPDSDYVVIRAAAGVKAEWQEAARFKVGEGVAGRVVATGQPVYVPDVHSSVLSMVFDPDVHSVIAVPIAYQDRVIGSLNLDSTKPGAFAPEHERILTIAAAQIAAALEIARLYKQEAERAQKLVEANAELEAMEHLREELIQNLSHELRTPLTYVKGYVSLLQDQQLGPLLPAQIDALGIVLDKSETLQRLIQDVVLLEQISAQTLNITSEPFGRLVRQSFEAAQLIHGSQELTFELDMDPTEVWTQVDRSRLNQVIDNLINNAVKFTPQGGVITLRTRLLEDGQMVECSVSDTGIGIPEDKLNRIFDRFFQVRDPARKGIGGSGIGLAIVQKVVEAHHGEVRVESTPGKGSTFYFTLPCQEGPIDET